MTEWQWQKAKLEAECAIAKDLETLLAISQNHEQGSFGTQSILETALSTLKANGYVVIPAELTQGMRDAYATEEWLYHPAEATLDTVGWERLITAAQQEME
jgi:hypothetical protein